MLLEILLIGISLSMDAFAVTLSSGMVYRNLNKMRKLSMPVAFGAFQGIMPVLGYFLGSIFSDFINAYSGIVSFAILGIIGVNMIREGIKGEECECKDFTFWILILQAVATSIDAFAVGVSFTGMNVQILPASLLIAASTFIITMSALVLGKYAGEKLGDKSVIAGGIILILIGIKALLNI